MKRLLALISLAFALSCSARLVTTKLAWDASRWPGFDTTNGVPYTLDHYTVYYQTGTGDYRYVVVPASQTTVSLTLQSSTTYKFFATARNDGGFVSESSNQITYKTRRK